MIIIIKCGATIMYMRSHVCQSVRMTQLFCINDLMDKTNKLNLEREAENINERKMMK